MNRISGFCVPSFIRGQIVGTPTATLVVLLMLLVPHAQRVEAQVGDPQAGAGTWDLLCDNCHGKEAEGAFGPDLAGGRG